MIAVQYIDSTFSDKFSFLGVSKLKSVKTFDHQHYLTHLRSKFGSPHEKLGSTVFGKRLFVDTSGGLVQLLGIETLSVWEVWSLIPRTVISEVVLPTARHRCDVSSELCSSGTKPGRWAPPLVTRFGV